MLSIFCALWGKCQGPGQGCVIKAATIKEASCGQELLKLLDEQVVPTRGKRQHLQRMLYFKLAVRYAQRERTILAVICYPL